MHRSHKPVLLLALLAIVLATHRPDPCIAEGLSRQQQSALALSARDPFLALARDADVVAVMSLGSRRSYWAPRHDIILTEYRLVTTSTLHGLAPATLTVVEEGGEVGDVGLAVSDAMVFELGKSYVLLLERRPNGLHVLRGIHGMRQLESATRQSLLRDLGTVLEARLPKGQPR